MASPNPLHTLPKAFSSSSYYKSFSAVKLPILINMTAQLGVKPNTKHSKYSGPLPLPPRASPCPPACPLARS